ncbi:MAG: hypothetical protein WAL22_23930 [Solirubrobacteraceae bacterium]
MGEQHRNDTGEQLAAPDWTRLTDLELVNQLVNAAGRNRAEAAEVRGALLLGACTVPEESAVAARRLRLSSGNEADGRAVLHGAIQR